MKILTVMFIASVISVSAFAADRNPSRVHAGNHANALSPDFDRRGARDTSSDYTRDSARLHTASVEFAAEMKRYGEKSTLHDYARKLSREAYRFHISAISADPRSSKVQDRYEELVKYYYRFERSYYASLDYNHGHGSRLSRSYRELNRAFESLSNSYLYAQSIQHTHNDHRAYAPPPGRREWQPDRREQFRAPITSYRW